MKKRGDEFSEEVDIYKMTSEMLVDGIVAGSELRDELIKRFGYAESKQHEFPSRRNTIAPV